MFGLYKKHGSVLPELLNPRSRFIDLTQFVFPKGLVSEVDDYPRYRTSLSSSQIAALLEEKQRFWECKASARRLPLSDNIDLLGEVVGLSSVERAVLFFALFLKAHVGFHDVLEEIDLKVDVKQLTEMIGQLTGHPSRKVIGSLLPDSTLCRTGLVVVSASHGLVEEMLETMDGLLDRLRHAYRSAEQLVSSFLCSSDPPTLELDDFGHLASDMDTLRHYLGNARKQNVRGVNILLYGLPGTGKTQFAKTIASAIGCQLYEVGCENVFGTSLSSKGRLRLYACSQRLLEKTPNVLLLFDEMEDAFPSAGYEHEENTAGKAWLNQTLESNPVPCLWITNDPSIDHAYLRRFDYSIRFPLPPIKVRRRMALHHMGDMGKNENWLARIAAHENVSPAQYCTAAKVASHAADNFDEARIHAERALERSMRLLGQHHSRGKHVLHTNYKLDLLNADHDINQIIAGLKRRPRGTFCFYGPPGTGKSELARHITDEIGSTVIMRRASDLLSKWVGDNEQNIATMFAEAREESAVLVLDEADSFLRERRGAGQQWEITQVNELLTQMEAFDGIFICTTNLMENLDQASLRRFDFKILLDYLKPEQRQAMFLGELERMNIVLGNPAPWVNALQRLERLTPGDFAVAARKMLLLESCPAPDLLYDVLQKEVRAKGGGRKIGFVA